MAMSMCVVLVSLVAFVDSNDNTDQVQMAMNLSMGNEKHHRSTHAQLNHPIADSEPEPDLAKKYDWRYLECWGVCGGAKQCNACNSKSEVESTKTNGVVRGGCCALDEIGNHRATDPEVCKKVPKHRFNYGLNTGVYNGKTLKPTDRYHMCVLVDMQCDDLAHGFVNHGADIKKECPPGGVNCMANPYAKSCPKDQPIVNNFNFCFGQNCNVLTDRARCCRHNICTCKDGTPKTADAADDAKKCKHDNANDCVSCKKGYHLVQGADGQQCKPNECKCPNGDKTSGTAQEGSKYFCEDEAQEDCSKCDGGYHSDSAKGTDFFGVGPQKCVINVCTCPGNYGTPGTGTACTTHGGSVCTDCKDGYEKPAGKSICEPSQCQQKDWATLYPKMDFSKCSSLKTKETCSVGCAKGYSGSPETWTCGADEQITGTDATCEGETCNKDTSDVFTNDLVHYGSCANKTTGETCIVKCKEGYSAVDDSTSPPTRLADNKKTLECTKDGWKGSITCNPNPCSAMDNNAIKNGKPGKCGNQHTESNQDCEIDCNKGYTVQGKTTCTAGTFSPIAKCVEEVCAGPQPPKYGFKNAGTCGKTLEHGGKCKFECTAGYEPTESSCDKGTLKTEKYTCQPKLNCELQWKHWCSDMYGYWTNAAQNLNYEGCEAWCNSMNDDSKGQKIFGCELAEVPGKPRASVGKWCFAHELCQTLQPGKDRNAANKCTKYGASSKQASNVD